MAVETGHFSETWFGDGSITTAQDRLFNDQSDEAMFLLRWLDCLVGYAVAGTKWLVLPLMALLFLQWPLRDWFHHYSREANDLGQIFFAFFVAVSVTAATRARTHLAADMLASEYSSQTRQWLARLGAAAGLLPWALFVLVAGKSSVVPSVLQFESFQDSGNPGYFLIKIALWIMALTIVFESVLEIFSPRGAEKI
jgi:TRAP-type mannitol/chloroaromatic compound transport system permease small subunit